MKYTEAQRALAKQRAHNAIESRQRAAEANNEIEWDQLIANLKKILGLDNDHR